MLAWLLEARKRISLLCFSHLDFDVVIAASVVSVVEVHFPGHVILKEKIVLPAQKHLRYQKRLCDRPKGHLCYQKIVID